VVGAGTGIYLLTDCVRLLGEPRETVREWTTKGLAPSRAKGQRVGPAYYTFLDLVSLYVVSELRRRGIPLQRIRKAEQYLRDRTQSRRPLATEHLYTDGRDIFIHLAEEEGEEHLVAASRGGQGAIEEAFQAVLRSIVYEHGTAAQWNPWDGVALRPDRQFGAPCVVDTGIQTATLYGFIRAGDDLEYVASLYDLSALQVAHAVAWEENLARRN
jgi:uncharacterized protein (DUF433 family)/DNA-binding transcriptional MerR regulator